MKKKVSLFALLVTIVFLCAACGDTNVVADSPVATKDPVPTTDPSASYGQDNDDDSWYTEEDIGFDRVPESELIDDPIEFSEDDSSETVESEHGIYALAQTGGTSMEFKIYRINPETAQAEVVREFSLKGSIDGKMITPGMAWDIQYYCVSPDLSKITVTLPSDNDPGFGWRDVDGNYYDIRKALNLSYDDDFYNGRSEYFTYGFTIDGDYVFAKLPAGENYRVYYTVPVDNLSMDAVVEYKDNPLQVGNGEYTITDRLSETELLVDGHMPSTTSHHQIYIYNTTTNEATPLLPDNDQRCVYNGVLSPDGSQIAFLTEMKTRSHTDQATEIYICGRDGSNPILLSENPFDINNATHWIFRLLDWR